MDQSLNQKTVLITGASRGLGAAFAEIFAQSKAFVAINYKRKKQHAEATLESVRKLGGDGVILPFDVTKPDAIEVGIKNLIELRGSIDVLVNNAGVVSDNYFSLMKKEEWSRVIDVNLHGVFNTIQAVLPYMLKQGNCSIVNIASVAGIHASPGQSNYVAAKAGLIGLTSTLSSELAPKGIRVNVVVPGLIASGMGTRLNRDIVEAKKESIPLGRLGKAEEVAEAVIFLASEKSSYITGQCLVVDGGLTN